jgi:hypothetical protein
MGAVAPYNGGGGTKWTLVKYYRYRKVYVAPLLYTVLVVEDRAVIEVCYL